MYSGSVIAARHIDTGPIINISSGAGFGPVPGSAHYGAAKAGLTRFCEGLLLRCQGHPFSIRILKAGFITSPMTDGKAPPLLCTAPEKIAKILLRQPQRRGIEYIPWWWDPVMKLIRRLPAPLASKL